MDMNLYFFFFQIVPLIPMRYRNVSVSDKENQVPTKKNNWKLNIPSDRSIFLYIMMQKLVFLLTHQGLGSGLILTGSGSDLSGHTRFDARVAD